MYLYSGGAGNIGRANGGFNGGGLRDSYNGGGGASDIRIAANNLQSRVIVAGGGGSDGAPSRTGMYGVELLVVLLLKALVLVVVEVHKPQAALEAIIIAVLLELVARV